MRVLEGIAAISTPDSISVSVINENSQRVPYEFRGFIRPGIKPTEAMKIQMIYSDESQLQPDTVYEFYASAADGKFEMNIETRVTVEGHKDAQKAPDVPRVMGWGQWREVRPVPSALSHLIGNYCSVPNYSAYQRRMYRYM
jgi:hypothetical protein